MWGRGRESASACAYMCARAELSDYVRPYRQRRNGGPRTSAPVNITAAAADNCAAATILLLLTCRLQAAALRVHEQRTLANVARGRAQEPGAIATTTSPPHQRANHRPAATAPQHHRLVTLTPPHRNTITRHVDVRPCYIISYAFPLKIDSPHTRIYSV